MPLLYQGNDCLLAISSPTPVKVFAIQDFQSTVALSLRDLAPPFAEPLSRELQAKAHLRQVPTNGDIGLWRAVLKSVYGGLQRP